jgi:hypothetical protein
MEVEQVPQQIRARWLDPTSDMAGDGVVYLDGQGNPTESVPHPTTGEVRDLDGRDDTDPLIAVYRRRH